MSFLKVYIRNRSVGSKLLYLLLTFTLTGLAVLAIAIISHNYKSSREDSLLYTNSIAEIISGNIQAALLFNDKASVEDTISIIKEIPQFQSIIIYDKEGGIYTYYHRLNQIPPPQVNQDNHQPLIDKGVLSIHKEIVVDDERIGNLVLQYDLIEESRKLIELTIFCIFTILFILIVMLVLLRTFKDYFVWPILQLSETAEKVSKHKDYSLRVKYKSKDEIGKSIQAFNGMLETIESQDITLKELNSHLEERVQLRTEKLNEALGAAKDANDAKTRFLANMSHEIRTPLNGIIGLSHIAIEKSSGPSKKLLQEVNKTGNSLLHIINEILDLSKIEAGKMQIESVPFETTEMFDVIKSIHFVKAKEKGVDFEILLDPQLPSYLIGDETKIRQVLINLIGNAIKFTSVGKVQLFVKLCEENEDTAIISYLVKDTGIGIPQAKLKALFDPFVQLDDSASRRFGGTGLGLAICKEIINQLNSEIEVNSILNGGSEFSFKIRYKTASKKVLDSQFNSTLKRSLKSKKEKLSGRRFLVVDDNETNLVITKHIIENLGGSVITAYNGQECLDLVKRHRFELIMMDLQMPIMTGYEAIQKIRGEHKVDTPVIALTAHAFSEDRKRCLDEGFSDYITKPIDADKLINSIILLLENADPVDIKLNKEEDKSIDEQKPETQKLIAFWEEIEGLNFQDALSRMLNNKDLYSSLLSRFESESSGYMDKIQKAFDSQECEEIIFIIHKLTNVLCNLGFDSFVDRLQRLEKELRDQGYDQDKHQSKSELIVQEVQNIKNCIRESRNSSLIIK